MAITPPQRIQRLRTKGWSMPANTTYVGRPTIFGNPWKIRGLNIDGPGGYFITADEPEDVHKFAVLLYRKWLTQGNNSPALMCLCDGETTADRAKLEQRRQQIITHLPILRGRHLACWCPVGLACHADVLLGEAWKL